MTVRARANRLSVIVNQAGFDVLEDFLKRVSGFRHWSRQYIAKNC